MIKSSDARDINDVIVLLSNSGVEAQKVQESIEMRCDLRGSSLCEAGTDSYLIEIKSMNDDDAMDRSLRLSGEYSRARPTAFSATLQRNVLISVRQMSMTSRDPDALRIIAIINRAKQSDRLFREKAIGTLLGARMVICQSSCKSGKVQRCVNCLYFAESAFFRHRNELDAAILLGHQDALLFVNDHSPRAERVRRSSLGHTFAKNGALNDIANCESKGMLVVDASISRDQDKLVLDYLKKKYNLSFAMEFHPTEYSSIVRVSRDRAR